MAMQAKKLTFVASAAPQTITWDTPYANSATFPGITTTDGSTPAYKFTAVSSAGLTVTPSIAFTGSIQVTQIEIPA